MTEPTFTVNDFISDMQREGEHFRKVLEDAIEKIHEDKSSKDTEDKE